MYQTVLAWSTLCAFYAVVHADCPDEVAFRARKNRVSVGRKKIGLIADALAPTVVGEKHGFKKTQNAD